MSPLSALTRIAAAALGGVLALLVSGCSLLGPAMGGLVEADEPYVDPDQVTSNETFDRIIAALETNDKDAITALFSPLARRAVDFEEELETLFGFTDGDFIVNDIGPEMPGMVRTDTNSDGRIWYEVSEGRQVESDGQTFYFYIIIVTRDTGDFDNVGLKSIRAVKADRWWRRSPLWDRTDTPGVHTEVIESASTTTTPATPGQPTPHR